MNLYEIDAAIGALVDQETGEIQDWEAFEQLQLSRDVKIENVACWYKNLMADVEAIKAEENRLKERRQVLENQAKRKLEYLRHALAGQKFLTARCSVTWRKTTRVEVEDAAALIRWAERNGHQECVTYKAPEINRTEVGKLLKARVDVPGAALAAGVSMSVK